MKLAYLATSCYAHPDAPQSSETRSAGGPNLTKGIIYTRVKHSLIHTKVSDAIDTLSIYGHAEGLHFSAFHFFLVTAEHHSEHSAS